MKTLKKNGREGSIGVRISLLFAIVVLLSTFGFPKACASTIIIEIEAVVDAVLDNGPGDGYLDGKINVGDIITGYYTYESTTPDSSPLDPVQGNYWHYATPAGISLNVGGFNFETDPCDVEFHVAFRNDIQPSGEDIYAIVSYNNIPFSEEIGIETIFWQLDDPTGTALSSDELSTTAPVLSDWDSNYLSIEARPPDSCVISFGIGAHVTSVEVIPEPTTVFLFGFGFLLLRKRK